MGAALAEPDALPRIAKRSGFAKLERAIRDGVESGEFEQTIFDGGTPRGDAQCQHYFGDGVYVRSLWIPAGTCVIGRWHKQARVCLILAGSCRFTDEFQDQVVEAPWIGEFKAGSQTIVYAETDCLWAAAVGTDLKDSRTAFHTLTCANREEAIALLEQQK
jgi:hypothetical protein